MSADKSLAAKIRALQAKTLEAGCTEAEALEAAAKVRELLERYQLDASEVELRAEGANFAILPGDPAFIAALLGRAVGAYTGTKIWRHPTKWGRTGVNRGKVLEHEVKICGLASDVIFAEWLLTSLRGFVQAETLEFALSEQELYLGTVESFTHGAIERIKERLKEALPTATPQGTALVVSKNGIIAEALYKAGISFVKASPYGHNATREDALAAGREAGDRASFNRPLRNATLAIGGTK